MTVRIYTGAKSSSNIFLYIMYSIEVPEDRKKVMSSAKFLRKKGPIYSLLEGG